MKIKCYNCISFPLCNCKIQHQLHLHSAHNMQEYIVREFINQCILLSRQLTASFDRPDLLMELLHLYKIDVDEYYASSLY
jgi:hypothetical protein